MNRRAEGREGCVRACFCAARSYNRGEPQGAANSPRLSNRFGGLASWLRLLVLADREPFRYCCQEPQQAGSELKDRRYQGQNGHGVHLPPSVPLSGASGGKGCGAAPPLRFVPLSIATAYHAQMARIQRGSSSISRAFNALPTRIPYFLPVFPTRFERTPGVGLASI